MKAMILSGGRGKRLRPVTDTIPKPLIRINNKPLIEWKINYLKKFGIKDIIICSGYKGKKIENYISKKNNFGCNIEYSVETSPLGTAGAIKKAIKKFLGIKTTARSKWLYCGNGSIYRKGFIYGWWF